MILYQIGHVPIFSYLSELDSDLGMISDLSWKVPTVERRLGSMINLSNRDANYNSQTITVSGDLIGTEDLPVSLARKELELLGGQKRVPIISFELIEDSYGNPPALVWYIAYGTLATMSRNFSLRTANSLESLPLSLTLVLESVWQPLNDTYWKYIPSGIEYNLPLSSPTGVIPERGSEIKGNWIFYFDPSSTEADYYAISLLLAQGNSLNRYGLDWTAIADLPTSININTTPYVWNAFPTTLYFFKNLPTTDTDVTVTVNQYRPYSSEAQITEVSSFNCQDLDELMATKGYTNLLTTDIIVLGDTKYFPGFVIRSGVTILSDVRINATFSGLSFGQLYTETNQITISSATTTIQSALYTKFNRI